MNPSSLRVRSRLWIWSASIWFGVGIIDSAQTVIVMQVQGTHHTWFQIVGVSILFWLPWALATVPIIHLGRRFPPVHVRPFLTWVVHAAAFLTIRVVFALWTAWLGRFLELYPGRPTSESLTRFLLERFLTGTLFSLILYAGILIVSSILDSRARLAEQQMQTARLNEQLSIAQLDALRKQIEPHFLFNTLNAISGLVRAERNEDAVTVIAGLSDFLRHTLEYSSRQQVALAEEIDFVEMYLSIQKVRFADRLHIALNVPLDLYQTQVPTMILQPIVENAVKHGIAKRAQGGTIRIAASRDGDKLVLTISNDGPHLLPSDLSGSGIGNVNVRTRLKSLYGNDFGFTMRDGKEGGVEVTMSIPYLMSSHVERSQ